MIDNKKTVFLVDDSPTNLNIGKNALNDQYNTFAIPSGELLFKMLKKSTPDLILLDVEMPKMDGYTALKKLKETPEYSDIPVVFVTGKTDIENELHGLSLGAVDYITKPFSPPLLLKRVEMHILMQTQTLELKDYNSNLKEKVKEKTKSITELQNAMITTFAEVVECRDDVTGGHIARTQLYLKIMVDALLNDSIYAKEIESWDMEFFYLSSQLHDVGKISISDEILKKPGKLTDEEFTEIKKHVDISVKIIEKIEQSTAENSFLEHAKKFASAHHEKWNGMGYPLGLKGADIPLQGRLMAIADVYDALVSARPYKPAFSHLEASKLIIDGREEHFDPVLVDVFSASADDFKTVAETIE